MWEHPLSPRNKFLYTHPYLSEVLNVDHFDITRRNNLILQNLTLLNPGDIVIWDNWFAVIETKTDLDKLLETPALVREIDYAATDEGREVRFVIFRKE
jgi:hypothetical protein